MKILGIATSPRNGANSQTLVEHILTGAREAGATTELVRLCDLDIQPCTGCNTCITKGECILQDDMADLWEKLAESDAVVFGSPIYWMRLNAQAYPFIDRFYAHLKKPDFSCDLPKGKKLVVALTCGGLGPEVLNPVNEYVKNVFQFLGFVDAGFIWQNHCFQPQDLATFPDKIREAKMLGQSLVK
jgi:multimeric flavodoxin WrbA